MLSVFEVDQPERWAKMSFYPRVFGKLNNRAVFMLDQLRFSPDGSFRHKRKSDAAPILKLKNIPSNNNPSLWVPKIPSGL